MDKYTKTKKNSSLEDTYQLSDSDLESTLETYLNDEKPTKEKPAFLNFVTISGMAFLLVGFLSVLDSLFSMGTNVDRLIGVLPIIGGLLVVSIGLGFFTRNQDKVEKKKKTKRKETIMASTFSGSKKSDGFDEFALQKKKKLFRSRKDSKFMGVCGGLADYFGLDSTLVRIAFVALFFFGYGSPLLVYLALGIILPKEKKDFNPQF
ncbi:MAG: PspC domain-containing protein [Balneolales bacterium]|nr:PspC domain-containing protein [Balneolales bacterium]